MGICPNRHHRYQQHEAPSSPDSSFASRTYLRVKARTLSGTAVVLKVKASGVVFDLRLAAAEHLGVPASRLLLTSQGGAPLIDHQGLSSLAETCAAFSDDADLEMAILVTQMQDCIYVCGGSGPTGNAMSSVERFDPNAMQWEAVVPMNEGRDAATGGRIGREIYIFGGASSDGSDVVTSASIEVFKPDSSVWEIIGCMPEPCAGASAAAVEERFFLFGGENPTQGFFQWSTVRAFNIDRSSWSACPDMNQARSGACVVALDRYVYVFGGHWQAQELSVADRYDTVAQVWEQLPSMSEQRAYAGAAALGDLVYVCGGWTGLHFLKTVARFNPTAKTWERMPDMLEARAGAAVATLGDFLYVCAGSNYAGSQIGFQRLASCERLDVQTHRWQKLPDLSAGRYRAVAITLASN